MNSHSIIVVVNGVRFVFTIYALVVPHRLVGEQSQFAIEAARARGGAELVPQCGLGAPVYMEHICTRERSNPSSFICKYDFATQISMYGILARLIMMAS
jgi:hypothetical protein